MRTHHSFGFQMNNEYGLDDCQIQAIAIQETNSVEGDNLIIVGKVAQKIGWSYTRPIQLVLI